MTTNPPAPAQRPQPSDDTLEAAVPAQGAPAARESASARTFSAHGKAFTRLPRRALTVWRAATVLFTAGAVLVVGGLGAALVPRLWASVPPWPGWCAAGVVAAVGLVRFARLPARWARTGFHLADQELWIQTGLWRRTLEILPYGRIQSVEVESGPLQRRYQLVSVIVATGSFHSFWLHNMDVSVADEIRDQLLRAAQDQQVAL
ncbi:PH domain-containing protein [Streptomyces sp. NPDC059743]|uniref:PH domain-containing protein n=1 Tax=Streptomyces sp. NPDC059743 TaxID=3346928 RepID=UPI00365263CA